MAVALAFPETQQGKKRTSEFSSEVSDRYINQARFVLRHCLDKAEEVLRNAHYPLTKAYEEVQAMVEQQRKDEEERQERLLRFLKYFQCVRRYFGQKTTNSVTRIFSMKTNRLK